MDVSIIICTRNRCESLARTIESLRLMSVPEGVAWEAVVVDNNSSDNTKRVVEGLMAEGCPFLRYLPEPGGGVSKAKNSGIRASGGKIIALTDDDCIMDPLWLARLVEEFESEEVAGVGGRVELYDRRDKPVTIKTSTEREVFSSLGQLFGFAHGCNMAFRRAVVEGVGGFDERLGPGTSIPAAEDCDFLYRVFKMGRRIIYTPELLVYHNHGRRTDAAVKELMNSYMEGRGAFYLKNILERDRMVLKMAYWDISAMVRTVLDGAQGEEVRYKTRAYLKNIFRGACHWFLSLLTPGEPGAL